jgi:imidazolonepropionase-like amidohydrolase
VQLTRDPHYSGYRSLAFTDNFWTVVGTVKAGVKMIFGTDAGVYPHGDAAKQFVTIVTWGEWSNRAARRWVPH